MNPKTFSKMHGLGNDFIVLDCRDRPFDWDRENIRRLADRHRGIGFDQLLIIARPSTAQADFTYRIFNADGGEVEHCGNGARCFGKYLRDRQLFDFTRPVRAEIKRGITEIAYCGGDESGIDQFRVAIAVPDFTAFTAAQESTLYQPLHTDGESGEFAILSLGNPHAVCEVADCDRAPVRTLGKALQRHPLFPEQVNVGFMQILDPQHIRLRVYERGVGETQACGTGACAAAAAGIARGNLHSPVRVTLPGGTLRVDWAGGNSPLYLQGAAETVFHGTLA